MPLFSWRELKRVYYHVSYHVFITNSTKFEVIASNFSRFVSYEVYNQRFEINESLAFLHFLGEKRLTKVDFVIVLGRVFHNVLFSACLFCLLTLFGFFISLKTDLQLSQRTKASSNRSSDSGDVTQQVIFYTQIKGDVENLILNNYLLRNQKSAFMSI